MNSMLDTLKYKNKEHKAAIKAGSNIPIGVEYKIESIDSNNIANIQYSLWENGIVTTTGTYAIHISKVIIELEFGVQLGIFTSKLRHSNVVPIFISNFSIITDKHLATIGG